MIKVLQSGFYSTIQDLGRFGYQDYGVPYSGVMDKQAATIANTLLGNHENNAVLEITMTGPKL
jgi:allophanate hydrolase subunit 2